MVRETVRHRASRRPQHSILNTEWHVQKINVTKDKKGVKFIYIDAIRYMRQNVIKRNNFKQLNLNNTHFATRQALSLCNSKLQQLLSCAHDTCMIFTDIYNFVEWNFGFRGQIVCGCVENLSIADAVVEHLILQLFGRTHRFDSYISPQSDTKSIATHANRIRQLKMLVVYDKFNSGICN